MKRIIRSSIVLLAVALATGAQAQSFTSGNLVIYRLGGNASGTTAGSTLSNGGVLTNWGTAVWLDEYTTSGTFVRSHLMPTNYFGGNSPLIANGTVFGGGLITRSVDGRFIMVNGYGATLGQFSNSVESTYATEAPRVIGLVDGNGKVDTTTTQTNSLADLEDMRSSVSPDGTNLWFSGDTSGVRYTPRGSPAAVHFGASVNNVRQLQIANNQIYYSTQSGQGVYLLTNNTPNTLPTVTNNVGVGILAGVTNSSPESFFFLNLRGGLSADTLYVIDGTAFNVYKFSSADGTNWSNNGSIETGAAVGLTGQMRVVGTTTNVDLWMTGGGGTLSGADGLYTFTDASGYGGNPGGSAFAPIVSAPGGISFRGVALAPVGGETFPAGPGQISVGPVLGLFSSGLTGCSESGTLAYSIGNFGTVTVNWSATADQSWVTLTPSSGTLAPGIAATVVASFNGSVTSLLAGTNTANITFTNSTAAPDNLGTAARQVRLILADQTITPSTAYSAAGQPGGPFTPATKVYTVKNGSTPITLTVSKSASWLNLSATSVSLGACASTNITVSINTANANVLSIGTYLDTISFSNNTGLIDTRGATLAVGNQFFCDNFSTFIQNTTLAPQQGWTQVTGETGVNPIMVTNGAAVVPGGATGISQEIYKNFPPTTNNLIFVGMVITVTNAQSVDVTSPARALCWFNQLNAGNYAVDYVSMRDTGTNTSTFVFALRGADGAGAPWQFGTTPLNYGTAYRVIQMIDPRTQAGGNSSNVWLWVNPSSPTLNLGTTYMTFTNHLVFSPDAGVASFSIQNSFSATSFTPGLMIKQICISTNYTEVYNDITSVAPSDPFTTWQAQYFTGSPLSSAPGADPLGKGMSNTNQFLAGFNPTNAAAYVHITSISKTNGGTDIRVDYLGASGNSSTTPPMASRTNVLEFTAGTGGGNYSSNGFASTGQTNILSGGTGLGTLANMVDPGGATNTPSRYYRVRVLVP